MKKSKIYRLAQLAVIKDDLIAVDDKLEILRVLMTDEDVAEYCESNEVEQE